jgi:hypothetical protein
MHRRGRKWRRNGACVHGVCVTQASKKVRCDVEVHFSQSISYRSLRRVLTTLRCVKYLLRMSLGGYTLLGIEQGGNGGIDAKLVSEK